LIEERKDEIFRTQEEINELKEENTILKKNSSNVNLLTNILNEIVPDNSTESENSNSSNSAN